MMFCVQCGKEISDAAKFCPHCGAVTTASAPKPGFTLNSAPTPKNAAGTGSYSYGSSPSYSAGVGGSAPASRPTPPEDTEKHGKKGLFIGGAVAAVAVVAAVVFMLVSGVFSSPKGRVEAAFAKTMSAFSKAGEGMGLPNMAELTQSKSVSQSFSMELNSVNSELVGYDLSSLRGLGLRMSADYDQKGRKAGAELAAFWGDNEICSFLMAANDNVLSFASPQFTGGDAYGLDTETLGADLVRLGAEDEYIDVSSIGFNLFDLAEETAPSQQPKEMEQKLKEAGKKLEAAIKVEKAGKKTIEVNENSVNADKYLVTIPEQAMEDYIDALSDAMAMVDSQEQSRKFLRGIGLDEDAIRYLLPDMSGMDPYGEMFDALKRALQEMGDLELEVYLNGGYVCAVEYSKEQNGSRLELGLYLGGGDNYVDDFSFRIAVDDEEIVVESTGNHGGKDGVFTDATTLRARSGGSTLFRVSSNFSYEPKAKADNFEWRLNLNNMASVKMAGQLTTGKDSLDLQLDDVSLMTAGMEICSLSMDYHVGPFDGVAAFQPNPTLLGDMDLDDLESLYYDIEYYAMEWQYDMLALIPEDLLWAFY
ncbi:MAG: zinc ribbon domain-containing protein [Oscillospiraceae bacterium]|nr:zinc ribbon domain-containing protein [Oscillospiraceae bacterium]MDE7172681.1 zinc ribbon domain-containing protein [Oscillospiraceae bacterium]